jgi:hypothetical protein
VTPSFTSKSAILTVQRLVSQISAKHSSNVHRLRSGTSSVHAQFKALSPSAKLSHLKSLKSSVTSPTSGEWRLKAFSSKISSLAPKFPHLYPQLLNRSVSESLKLSQPAQKSILRGSCVKQPISLRHLPQCRSDNWKPVRSSPPRLLLLFAMRLIILPKISTTDG